MAHFRMMDLALITSMVAAVEIIVVIDSLAHSAEEFLLFPVILLHISPHILLN